MTRRRRRIAVPTGLVIAAMRHNTGSIVDEVPDTGELRGDVLAMLRRMVARFADVGPDIIHGIMADAPDIDPELFTVMGGAMATVPGRAAERGEIPSAEPPPRVVTLPADLVRHEMLLTRHPIPDKVPAEIVDGVFLPLVRRPGAPDRSRSERGEEAPGRRRTGSAVTGPG